MAPEAKTCTYGPASDVYSMGLVLYELLDEQLPAWNETKRVAVVPPSFPGQSVVLPCLQQDPTQRPTAAELLQMLEQWTNSTLQEIYQLLPESLSEVAKQIAKEVTGDGEELITLYNYLIKKDPVNADAILKKITPAPDFPSDSESTDPKQLHALSDGAKLIIQNLNIEQKSFERNKDFL